MTGLYSSELSPLKWAFVNLAIALSSSHSIRTRKGEPWVSFLIHKLHSPRFHQDPLLNPAFTEIHLKPQPAPSESITDSHRLFDKHLLGRGLPASLTVPRGTTSPPTSPAQHLLRLVLKCRLLPPWKPLHRQYLSTTNPSSNRWLSLAVAYYHIGVINVQPNRH